MRNPLPPSLIDSIKDAPGFDKGAFERIHASEEQVTAIRNNPLKTAELPMPGSQILWTRHGYYLDTRPSFTFDPLFHAGCYYVQEPSSMFLEQALNQTVDLTQPLKILDLSAAPGGKSTHIQSLISTESMLVSNEVIRARANILKDNIIKWGAGNVVVTCNDPKDFARLEGFFDVIVVDAPCSGSGLFRREPEAIDEWSLNNVALCSQRQQRILFDAWPALKEGGIVIYSTCSYSVEENERIMDWMLKELGVESLPLKVDHAWGITTTTSTNGAIGYRFWPDKLKGEGFFIACFRKTGYTEELRKQKIRSGLERLTKREMEVIKKWVRDSDDQYFRHENTNYAWPTNHADDFHLLLSNNRVVYSGVRIGELMRDKLVPDHALSMSSLVSDSIGRVEVSYEQAIRYLQRKELDIETPSKGWQLVIYKSHALGWINVLPNRINNYYPKELRILKETS
ncbi:MAG: Fmu (Sun) domain protein [Chitinophagaceae bacterium]|nr:Fmu (Sun) domain protein [Chitinophagaceae bacterium]